MADIVCQVINQDDQMEFIWSERGGFFEPYVIKKPGLTALRDNAVATRKALEALVRAWNTPGSEEEVRTSSLGLAEAGYQLFNRILPFYEIGKDGRRPKRSETGWKALRPIRHGPAWRSWSRTTRASPPTSVRSLGTWSTTRNPTKGVERQRNVGDLSGVFGTT